MPWLLGGAGCSSGASSWNAEFRPCGSASSRLSASASRGRTGRFGASERGVDRSPERAAVFSRGRKPPVSRMLRVELRRGGSAQRYGTAAPSGLCALGDACSGGSRPRLKTGAPSGLRSTALEGSSGGWVDASAQPPAGSAAPGDAACTLPWRTGGAGYLTFQPGQSSRLGQSGEAAASHLRPLTRPAKAAGRPVVGRAALFVEVGGDQSGMVIFWPARMRSGLRPGLAWTIFWTLSRLERPK